MLINVSDRFDYDQNTGNANKPELRMSLTWQQRLKLVTSIWSTKPQQIEK